MDLATRNSFYAIGTSIGAELLRDFRPSIYELDQLLKELVRVGSGEPLPKYPPDILAKIRALKERRRAFPAANIGGDFDIVEFRALGSSLGNTLALDFGPAGPELDALVVGLGDAIEGRPLLSTVTQMKHEIAALGLERRKRVRPRPS
jgi:hypothetical protein